MLRRLEFESDFFSMEYGENDCLSAQDAELMKYDVVQCLSDRFEKETKAFRYEDSRITFIKGIESTKSTKSLRYPFRKAVGSDIPKLNEALISPLVKHSRFCTVTTFSKCLAFYTLWANKAILGTFDDEAYLLEEDGEIIAFVSVRLRQKDASIGLLMVHPDHQEEGVGKALVRYIEELLGHRGMNFLSVVTEGKNVKARAFYERLGFIEQDVSHWYYWRK